MAAIKSVSMSRRENGRIYLSGYVDGLETGYNYCIVYSHNGGPLKNAGRNGMSYTFIGLSSIAKGTYMKHNFSDTNSWVPDDGDGTYKIICNMVGSRCEDIHILESARSFSVTTVAPPPVEPVPPVEPTPPTPPACNEGETVCEYNAAHNRHMIMKCAGGKMVFERWCGTDDTCEDGVCISPPEPTPTPAPPACEEGALVCEYHEGQGRYLLKKCVGGKMVFERWCGADDTCEEGVCIPPQKPECTEGDKKPGHICTGGKWVPYTPPVVPPVEPPVTPPAEPPKYLTPAQADERVRAGLPCYIKCTLPILDMLPGIPYTPGAWVLPFFTITSEP